MKLTPEYVNEDLFGHPDDYRVADREWVGMPAYEHESMGPWRTVTFRFATPEDLAEFGERIEQPIPWNDDPRRRQAVWHPRAEKRLHKSRRYSSLDPLRRNPQWPVYIVSKGRWESRMTVRSLERIGVPYHIVVEPQEFRDYASVIDPANILELPFSNLGQGSIPARNWIWQHATESGAAWHWILDDNIEGFYRFNQNFKTPVMDGAIFRAAEDFAMRYDNVAKAGFQYYMFIIAKEGRARPPFYLNTRVYSCILLRNDTTDVEGNAMRWRGRYNEDTDLSIRLLKRGYCTILYNAFLANKMTTGQMKGGNTDELYKGDGRLTMAQSLVDQHPDIVTITTKWHRPQHQVDYSQFQGGKQPLHLDPHARFKTAPDEYGMILEKKVGGEWLTQSEAIGQLTLFDMAAA